MFEYLRKSLKYTGYQLIRPFLWIIENPTIKLLILYSLIFSVFLGIGLALSALLSSTAILWGSFAVGVTVNALTYWFSDKLVVALTGAKNVDQDSRFTEIKQMLVELTHEANARDKKLKMTVPRLYFMNDRANAFATGRNPQNSIICVTSDLLKLFNLNYASDREALKGILAHEISHIRHKDILYMTTVTVIMSLLETTAKVAYYNARQDFWQPKQKHGNDNDNLTKLGLLICTGLLTCIVVPISKTLGSLFLSRTREYNADAGGFELMHNNSAPLIEGLSRLRNYVQNKSLYNDNYGYFNPEKSNLRNNGIKAMCLSPEQETHTSPVKGNKFFRLMTWLLTEGLSTHPRFDHRIAALQKLQAKEDMKKADEKMQTFFGDKMPQQHAKKQESHSIFGFLWGGKHTGNNEQVSSYTSPTPRY